jgi:hypothetical protein
MALLRNVGWARGIGTLVLLAIFVLANVMGGQLQQLAVFLVGILLGLGMIIWLLTGHELMRSRQRIGARHVELSPLLTRVASAMMALEAMTLGVLTLPTVPLEGPVLVVGVTAPVACLLCIVLGAIPETHGWGRRNQPKM